MARSRILRALEIAAAASVLVASLVFISVTVTGRSAGIPANVPKAPLKRPEPRLPSVPISIDGAAIKGDPEKARIAIIEFSDFECPFCARFARDILPDLDARYLGTSKAFLAFRHMPLEALHKSALDAAALGACASLNGTFWTFHDEVFKAEKGALRSLLDARRARSSAEEKGCVGKAGLARIRADKEQAKSLGVTGTPTFFVGLKEDDGQVKLLHRLSGVRSISDFADVIEPLLKAVPGNPPTR